uniref:calmodulin binding protein PICBP n=1 Tax=Erigeron canadensis TaxID=72917 RepID=UPI001CB96CC3|nr:calmodulin binding protein PICBP [Erigeron canadensis]
MVQRKVPNKLGIKPHHLKLDTQVVNLRPTSPQTNDKLKKIMKKSRPIKRSDESRSLPPFKKKKTHPVHNDEPRSTPNYMKSTSCFEARKEVSPKKLTPKGLKSPKTNGSRTLNLKMVRSLTKTPNFKPLRTSKKVVLCEDLDANRATCSSTLKDKKFPNLLELSPGGTELEGTSAMKVCPYTYCSLNGHRHAPLPPLKCFLSSKRRAMKTPKSFKLGCLSPHQLKPVVKKNNVTEAVIFGEEAAEAVDIIAASVIEEEKKDFFIEINGCRVLESSDIEWEEGYHSASSDDDDGKYFKLRESDGEVYEEQIGKTGDDNELQELYDEESVSSGAWSDEDADSESDGSYQRMKINHQNEDQECGKSDSFEVPSETTLADVNYNMDDEDKIKSITEGLNLPVGDHNIKYHVSYQQKETSQESNTVPEKSEDRDEKNHATIIYNIIQFNISVFVDGEKTTHSETEKGVNAHVPWTAVAEDKMETGEVSEEPEEQEMSNEEDEVNQIVMDEKLPFHDQDILSNDFVQDCNECEVCSQSKSMDVVTEIDEEPASRLDEQTHSTGEIASVTDIKTISFCKKNDSSEEHLNPSTTIRSTRGKKPEQEMGDSREFNPRGPNFLPEVPDPDAETVDLRHQDMDERKNAEEWMVDFALQQAVNTIAPVRKKKVASLVEAFEKVMPIPMYGNSSRHTSKAFTNARPMQACS